ncbi:U3 small nucleolar RNA-associated protein [Verticillium alfalfae VaMs.102]|uniref:U3 small nucleolar RNA-associated protein 10 n=1 Tax=Verticillium alfalfae (strain VaMs.102 / ATCC MYA-4576 / FGSC 10136) TaxID=526221 RepID=C9SUW1_VERA1|nr:U3 small nucleolar RNA-associated protein [Verticillium alfalfae VaMs.102]EEY22576.1 U3 small nucleolar RNA-associated protein [Verticillium alfalfae VaMs.102]
METSKMRELYATLLKDTLALAETVKPTRALHECCGSALANLLNLLSIGEFIKAVENLMDKTEIDLRRKVLRALEVRVEQEGTADATSRAALLGFLPQLTAAIRDTDDLKYKHTAVACVDKIAEKYGKKDLEAVAAAAATIAGPSCLGQPDTQLRVMTLLCLASLVDVLQDGILPVLALAVPQAILYIRQSLEAEDGDDQSSDLHNAGYSFITALAQHLPYMVTGAYLDQVLLASNASAEADLDDDASDSRLNCVRFLARKVEPKVFFAGLERNWEAAVAAGNEAPAHFGGVAGVLTGQLTRAGGSDKLDVGAHLIPALIELASAADSADHQKELNTAVLKHLRDERAGVRLAAVKCQQALTDKLGEEWLSALPEMLPYISELQDDDDEAVERETHRWIVKIEGVLGESLDSMLQ